jgi:hypothetical protein
MTIIEVSIAGKRSLGELDYVIPMRWPATLGNPVVEKTIDPTILD